MSFFFRWLIAFVLLSLTFNPTQFNYMRWAREGWDGQLPLVILAGLLLLTGYVIYLRATLRSIGAFGMLLVAAIFAAMIWVLYDIGLLTIENRSLNVWLGLFALSLVLGVGLSWSIIRRKLSGQLDVDDVEE